MATVTTVPKSRKPKTNNFVLILGQILEKYNLSKKSTLDQLSEHASELGASLPDWKARKSVKEALHRRGFSKDQIATLVPDKRNEIYSVKKRAQEVAKSGDKWEIFINTLDLGPKSSNDDKEIVASSLNQSRFRKYLAEYGADPELIDRYAKDSKTTTASNKIQQERTEKRLVDPGNIPEEFSLANMSKRIQNMDISKTPSMQDLADVMVMLSMRPAEVSSLQIINYKPDSEDPPAWHKAGYSWYCTGCRKQRENPMPMPLLSMEKNPERARELLTWIQDAIKARKLRDPVYGETGKRNTRGFNHFIKGLKTIPEITPEDLRKIGAKHASTVHAGPNPTPQHLENLSKTAIRHKIARLDAGKNYAIGDTIPKPRQSNYNPFESQIEEIDSMLAGF